MKSKPVVFATSFKMFQQAHDLLADPKYACFTDEMKAQLLPSMLQLMAQLAEKKRLSDTSPVLNAAC